MISLLFGISLAFAADGKELVTSKFLDEFYDYKISQAEQLDSADDTMYIELEEVEFLPEDEIDLLPDYIECTCDFTGESKPWLKGIHT